METEFDTPKVYTLVANLPKIFTNTVEILLQELIQDETGVNTHSGIDFSFTICLSNLRLLYFRNQGLFFFLFVFLAAMETEFDTPKVYTLVANLPKIFTNTVEILLQELIQDETGVVQVLTSDNINLNPSGGFTRIISRLLRDEQVPESQFLGQKIALDISRELANDDSLESLLSYSSLVNFIRETRLVFPPDEPTPSRGASVKFSIG
ncbi:unnamed protein product [Brassica napus]|uniref:(rape) hypothetical protein n=1 Tax=Brassica napus TaxID=3708 RepID=A0A816JE97_BRANA|nr:unnamed protein product [Brassica napus]